MLKKLPFHIRHKNYLVKLTTLNEDPNSEMLKEGLSECACCCGRAGDLERVTTLRRLVLAVCFIKLLSDHKKPTPDEDFDLAFKLLLESGEQ